MINGTSSSCGAIYVTIHQCVSSMNVEQPTCVFRSTYLGFFAVMLSPLTNLHVPLENSEVLAYGKITTCPWVSDKRI